MFAELTEMDLERLEIMRLDRFRGFFGEVLLTAILHLTADNRLIVIPSTATDADELLEDAQGLCYWSRVIVGAEHASVYFAEEEVWSSATGLVLESNSDSGVDPMTAATLERTTHPEMTNGFTSQPSSQQGGVDNLLNTIRQIESLSPEVRGLISADALEGMIDQWANNLKSQLRASGFGSSPAPTPTKAPTAAKTSAKKPIAKTAAKTATKKPAAKKAAAPKTES